MVSKYVKGVHNSDQRVETFEAKKSVHLVTDDNPFLEEALHLVKDNGQLLAQNERILYTVHETLATTKMTRRLCRAAIIHVSRFSHFILYL